jgi:hypothetical protein
VLYIENGREKYLLAITFRCPLCARGITPTMTYDALRRQYTMDAVNLDNLYGSPLPD